MSRFADGVAYPQTAYAEMAIVWFGANFLYHRNVFRRDLSKMGFGAFLLINAFTSFHVVESFNPAVIRYYAAAYNNTLEYQHRAIKNQVLRKKIFGFSDTQ